VKAEINHMEVISMQTHFLPVAQAQVAVAEGQIADQLALYLMAVSCLSAITLWLLALGWQPAR
ncbi:MAG: hypothetical protein ACHQ2F_05395, partial [Desulfobaccales bacterium]